MKKSVIIGIIILVVIIISGIVVSTILMRDNTSEVGETTSVGNKSESSSNKIDKYSGNGIKNSTRSRIAYKGSNAVYYKNYGDGNQIIRLDNKGNKTQILRQTPKIEFEKDNILYVSASSGNKKAIYPVDLKKQDYNQTTAEFSDTKIIDSAKLFFGVINNDIYYNTIVEIIDEVDEYGLPAKSHNEANLYKYNQDKDDTIIIKGIGEMYVYKDKVYYNKLSTTDSSVFSDVYEQGLYVSDINFSNESKIIETGNMSDLVVHNDSIFYLNSGKLYRTDLDGKNETLIIDEYIEEYQMTNNYIYYKTDMGNKLYKIDIDGKNEKQIIAERVHDYDLIDDYIYFVGGSDMGISRMKNDGSKVESIMIKGEIYPD